MNEIIEQALNQGVSSLITISVFLIVYKYLDNKKKSDSEKFMQSLGNTMSEVASSLVDLTSFIKNITENIINKDKDKCKLAIEDAMLASALKLTNFISSTIVNNHVEDNKENILINIHNIVTSEYYAVQASLALYEINNYRASDFMKSEWMDVIEKDMIAIIYNCNHLSKEDKILAFSNKITLKFQSYITYVTNHMIK